MIKFPFDNKYKGLSFIIYSYFICGLVSVFTNLDKIINPTTYNLIFVDKFVSGLSLLLVFVLCCPYFIIWYTQLYYYLALYFVTLLPAWRPCRARKGVSAYRYLAPTLDNDKYLSLSRAR